MALSREDEVRHLDQADVHVGDGERRITKQIALVAELRRDGHDTTEAEKMLTTLKRTLETMRAHRALIVDAIGKIDAGLN